MAAAVKARSPTVNSATSKKSSIEEKVEDDAIVRERVERQHKGYNK